MIAVTICVRLTVSRPNPSPSEARADAAMQQKLQAILDEDMQDRARRLTAVLNRH